MTMLTHPNEEVLQRFRHGELAAHQVHDCGQHMTVCALCRERVASLSRDEDAVLALLQSLDEPAPPVHVDVVVAHAKRVKRGAWYRLAAGIVFAVTALGAAYAMPGSPIKRWLRSLTTREVAPAGPSAKSMPPTAQSASGIAVVPSGRFVIRFDVAVPNGEALVSFTDDSTISVRTTLGGATFTSEADRLVVEPRGSALAVEIEIPRLAPRVEIQVAGERVFLKEGMRVITAQATSARERYSVPLTTPRR
jgi:hypothetical protein